MDKNEISKLANKFAVDDIVNYKFSSRILEPTHKKSAVYQHIYVLIEFIFGLFEVIIAFKYGHFLVAYMLGDA